MSGPRGGAVDGDDGAEADAEESRAAGQAEGTDGEVLLLREDLDGDRIGEFDAVLGAEFFAGAIEQAEHALAINLGFAIVHAHEEMRILHGFEFGEVIVERDEVVSHDVIRIFLEDVSGELPAFVFLPQAEQVLAELHLGWLIGRGEFQRQALAGRAFCEAIFLGEFLADQMIDFRIGVPRSQGGGAMRLFLGAIALHVRQHRAIGPGAGVFRIDLEGLGEQRLGLCVIFAIDGVVGLEQQAIDVARVERQGFDEGGGGALGVVLIGAGEAEVDVGIVRGALGGVLKGLGGEGEILLVERELTAGEVRLGGIGIVLFGLVEEEVDDLARISAAAEECATERDAAGGVGEAPGGLFGECTNGGQRLVSVVRPAI